MKRSFVIVLVLALLSSSGLACGKQERIRRHHGIQKYHEIKRIHQNNLRRQRRFVHREHREHRMHRGQHSEHRMYREQGYRPNTKEHKTQR